MFTLQCLTGKYEMVTLWICSSSYFRDCPVALSQVRFTYRNDLVLLCIVSNLSHVFAESQTIHIYADLPEMHASVSPQATISPTLIVTPYCPDIVICNESTDLIALLELTCPLPGFGLYSSFGICKGS